MGINTMVLWTWIGIVTGTTTIKMITTGIITSGIGPARYIFYSASLFTQK